MVKIKSKLFTFKDKLGSIEFRIRKSGVVELGKKRVPTVKNTPKQQQHRLVYSCCNRLYKHVFDELLTELLKKYRHFNLDSYRIWMKHCMGNLKPQHCVKITVHNPNDYDLIDFPILVELNSKAIIGELCNNNPNTILFYDDMFSNVLQYWVETWDTTNYIARIWVKIPQIKAKSDTNLFMLINNNWNINISNPYNIFIFFDHFEGDKLDTNKWVYRGYWFKVSNSILTMWGDWSYRNYYINSKTKFKSPIILVGKWRIGKINKDTDLSIALRDRIDGSIFESGYDCIYDGQHTYSWGQKRISYLWGILACGGKVTDTNWQYFMIKVTDSKIEFWDSLLGNLAVSKGINEFHLGLAVDADSDSFGEIDWVGVMPYASYLPQIIKIKIV